MRNEKLSVDGIIFDVDGTLWDSTPPVAYAWNKILEKEGLPGNLTADQLKKEFGKPLSEIGADLLPALEKEWRERILAHWIKAENEIIYVRKPVIYAHLEETLQYLSAKYPLFVVSNAEKGYIESLYEITGIGKYFKGHLCHEDTGRPKGYNIRLLADRFHLQQPIYVGDTAMDQEACIQAKVLFAHAAYGFGTVTDCDISLSKVSDLMQYF